MRFEYKLPDVGEGLVEAVIVDWPIKVGDVLKEDDVLVEIENDKSVLEIPSSVGGKVLEICVPKGEVAQVGQVIVVLEVEGDGPVEETKEEKKEVVEAVTENATAQLPSRTGSVKATPAVRKYARERGVDLSQVVPTGRRGIVQKSDVDLYLLKSEVKDVENVVSENNNVVAPAAEEKATQPEKQEVEYAPTGDWTEKIPPIRKAIAKAMVNSVNTIPHVHIFDKIDATKLVEHRNTYKDLLGDENVKLTYMPYFVKGMVAMLKAVPSLNAQINLEKNEILHKGNINIGIAINTNEGLFVPVVKDADKKSVVDIANEISNFIVKAKEGKLTPQDMKGGSATITNVGGTPGSGGSWATPIINYPESSIMGISRIEDALSLNEEKEVVVVPTMNISFAFDHRLIDGVEAQKALDAFKKALKDPGYMLLKN